jgi:hypothetical protein
MEEQARDLTAPDMRAGPVGLARCSRLLRTAARDRQEVLAAHPIHRRRPFRRPKDSLRRRQQTDRHSSSSANILRRAVELAVLMSQYPTESHSRQQYQGTYIRVLSLCDNRGDLVGRTSNSPSTTYRRQTHHGQPKWLTQKMRILPRWRNLRFGGNLHPQAPPKLL